MGLVVVGLFAFSGKMRRWAYFFISTHFYINKYEYRDEWLALSQYLQGALALLAARMAEELAHVREQQAWNRLSVFVLHDIKNAATMLSLLRENAPEHIHEPEFQRDMLEVVDDALRRMGRVEERLRTLKDEVMPEYRELVLGDFLKECRRRLLTQLPAMEIKVDVQDGLRLQSDSQLLFSILENLLLNAFEAGGEGTFVLIRVWRDEKDGQMVLEVVDSGPGIPAELLPRVLFEPFKTSKESGSGIGLWQVSRVVERLGGGITAANVEEGGGAKFVIRLPLG